MEKSKLEIAYEYVEAKNKVFTFKEIWKHVCKAKGLSEEEASKQVSVFYTTLLQDGRFVSVGDGKFDLKSRYSVAQINKYDNLVKEFEERSKEDDENNDEMDEEEVEFNKAAAEEEPSIRDDFGYENDSEEANKANDSEDVDK